MDVTSGGCWCWVGRRSLLSLSCVVVSSGVWRWWGGGACGLCWGVLWFSSLRVLSLRLLEKHRLSGGFVWWLFPSDPDLCGGGDGGVKWWCRPHFWWCEEVSVGLQQLGSIITFSSDTTTLLSGGFSMWIDGVAAGCCCCCRKGGFVVVFVVSIVIVTSCFVRNYRWHVS